MGPDQYVPGYGMNGGQMPPQGGQQFQRGSGYDRMNNNPSFQSFANRNNQTYQQPQEKFLVCKFVDNPDTIMPIDVPSNGDPAFFISRDFSCIYAKAMNNKGTIDEVMYAPVKRETPEEIQRAKEKEFQDLVNEKFAKIESMLSTLLSGNAVVEDEDEEEPAKTTPKNRKGANK